jgi:hypothetical protein
MLSVDKFIRRMVPSLLRLVDLLTLLLLLLLALPMT